MKKEIFQTFDNSPTLIFYSDNDQQMMHSRAGAFSESEYIYGEACDLALQHHDDLFAISVGLGFAYVEFSFLSRMFLAKKDFYLISYEKESELRQALTDYLENKDSIFKKEYEIIVERYCEKFSFEKVEFKKFCSNSLARGAWQIEGAFDFQQASNGGYNLILFDPFCSRFHPEMWQEAILTEWLKQNSQDKAVFATYAAKSNLNRALKASGFELIKKKGFAKKRESTLALKASV